MASVLILGGGFGGVVAAEQLAKRLAAEHQITLVSREPKFVFYPALVRVAFNKSAPEDVCFDLRAAMLDRRVRFIGAEVASVDPHTRRVRLAGGDIVGELSYDYLVFALGRRLATERCPGFFEWAHHLLSLEAARRFGDAVRNFEDGRIIVGYCPGAHLSVPAFETAFALAHHFRERGRRHRVRITVITPEPAADALAGVGGVEFASRLRAAMDERDIELIPNFPVRRITARQVWADERMNLSYNLLMLVPPFAGTGAALHQGVTNADGFLCVDRSMRVRDVSGMYAAGDCVCFAGPKMGHLAVRQADVAAANVAAEIEGRASDARYEHEVRFVIDTGDERSIYLHKRLWDDEPETIGQGRFWRWAKRVREVEWRQLHR